MNALHELQTDDWDDVKVKSDTSAEERHALGAEIRAVAAELTAGIMTDLAWKP